MNHDNLSQYQYQGYENKNHKLVHRKLCIVLHKLLNVVSKKSEMESSEQMQTRTLTQRKKGTKLKGSFPCRGAVVVL